MPLRPVHKKFYKFLKENGIFRVDSDLEEVHKFIDHDANTLEDSHQFIDPYHDFFNHEDFRNWLNGKNKVIGQERSTDWLHSNLGHKGLEMGKYLRPDDISEDERFESPYQNMCDEGLDKAKFLKRKK